MAADIELLIETAKSGFIPGDGHALAAVIEGFPDFAEALQAGLGDLGTWMEAELGAAEAETAGRVQDMAVIAGTLRDAAEEAAQAFTQVSHFWLGQES